MSKWWVRIWKWSIKLTVSVGDWWSGAPSLGWGGDKTWRRLHRRTMTVGTTVPSYRSQSRRSFSSLVAKSHVREWTCDLETLARRSVVDGRKNVTSTDYGYRSVPRTDSGWRRAASTAYRLVVTTRVGRKTRRWCCIMPHAAAEKRALTTVVWCHPDRGRCW